ncbi:protein MpCYP759B1 [Marchantia polymorpha subsp. ruderalis]|uniref:Cytochrome P450 n=2 Tax=Marchantia polymorpha TaxID=3197 RepID=A0A176VV52_MARPO|nr:hypothetical protein AXG93_2752s1880 [Marchantia polymorpha subsp. ruderalis]PTQ42080.1 hypothetical protein MARPO_0031s0060 [Marchantia polymorpha]PTQ42081.1 hypothetical protein MARPO_0031s0060 [Marchantia polymorpha]BBN01031.1 hypothetical protein Mp_2g04040 [Marchantia polymorpha subsp. ruderalis]BBN01032.1 hypothetical protein Mp_2g04040 [Marchantia polymorpha subsp. ruderalis]|eukprot:PTQ42080.1 hypothetical protein MARPO_0031s0060 [Marchantia polymorpha]
MQIMNYADYTAIPLWGWVLTLSAGLVVLGIVISILRPRAAQLNLPPCPGVYPIVGSLPLLGAIPGEPAHHMFKRLADKYGSLVYLRMGSCPTVIVSDSEFAKLVLKDQDHVFASRPLLASGKYIGMNFESLVFSPMGNHYKKLSKIYSSELLSPRRVMESQGVRENGMRATVKSIYRHAIEGPAVKLSSELHALGLNIMLDMIFGKDRDKLEVGGGERLSMDELKDVVRESLEVAAEFDFGEYIPIARYLDLTGIIRRMKSIQSRMRNVAAKLIAEHIQRRKITGEAMEPQDIAVLDVLLSLKDENGLSDDAVTGALFDMIVAGSDTTSLSADWAIAELTRNPELMKKLQDEADRVVGRDRSVKESDLPKMKYLQCVVKESMRIHSPTPLAIPHCSVQATKLGGYDIPAGCTVLMNLWAINRDPKNWPEPHKFKPERFENHDTNIFGQDFTLLPFSAGRRGCSGMLLGFTMVQLIVATLVHSFDLRPHGMEASEVDVISEKPGLTLIRPYEQLVEARPRLPLHLYN